MRGSWLLSIETPFERSFDLFHDRFENLQLFRKIAKYLPSINITRRIASDIIALKPKLRLFDQIEFSPRIKTCSSIILTFSPPKKNKCFFKVTLKDTSFCNRRLKFAILLFVPKKHGNSANIVYNKNNQIKECKILSYS